MKSKFYQNCMGPLEVLLTLLTKMPFGRELRYLKKWECHWWSTISEKTCEERRVDWFIVFNIPFTLTVFREFKIKIKMRQYNIYNNLIIDNKGKVAAVSFFNTIKSIYWQRDFGLRIWLEFEASPRKIFGRPTGHLSKSSSANSTQKLACFTNYY